MARLFLMLFVLCLCLAACGDMSPTPLPTVQPAAQPTPTTPPTADSKVTPGTSHDEDNIKEAILRYRFEATAELYTKEGGPPWKYYCLGSGTTLYGVQGLSDLDQAFLERFKGNNPQVVKASNCIMVDDKVFYKKAVLKTSGEPVRFWAVSAVTWLGKERVELEISLHGDFGDGEGKVYQLERQNGTWQVTGSTRTWVA
jgi:hypothetical protein